MFFELADTRWMGFPIRTHWAEEFFYRNNNRYDGLGNMYAQKRAINGYFRSRAMMSYIL